MTSKQYHSYKHAQAQLEALPKLTLTRRSQNPALGLERTRRLLTALGNPELGLRYIHITGTAGKGSVTAYLHEILLAAKMRVGSYVSPHVTTTLERIRVNRGLPSVADFLWAWQRVHRVIKKTEKQFLPSHFEALFAMSLLLFHKHRVQWAVVEVGCGGEFDPTNVIPPSAAAVITNIGLDHQQLLGRTRTQIAKTKAGICKPGSWVVTGERDPQIRRILMQVAAVQRCPITYIVPPKRTFAVQLPGAHQQHNAALAESVAKHLKIPNQAVKAGLLRARLPGRFEIVSHGPDVVLDGAHNRDKIGALIQVLRQKGYKRIHAVIGASEHKDVRTLFRPLLPLVDTWFCTQVQQKLPTPLPPTMLQATLKLQKPASKVQVVQPAQAAFQRACKGLGKNDAVIVTGSFYLVGELRQQWYSEKSILSQQTSFPHAKN